MVDKTKVVDNTKVVNNNNKHLPTATKLYSYIGKQNWGERSTTLGHTHHLGRGYTDKVRSWRSNDSKVVDFTKEVNDSKTERQTETGPKSGFSRAPGFLVDACISVANLFF